MIRAAKFVDTPRLIELMCEMQAASKYAGLVEVDRECCRRLLIPWIQRHGFTNDGAALVNVVERDGVIVGFMIGVLDRIYHMLSRLAAKDAFLYVTQDAHPSDVIKLVDAYLSWAEENPKVFETNLSWTDALPGAERIEALYRRKGFRRCGGIYERVSHPKEGAA